MTDQTETLGQRLKRLRLARGLSQRDLSEPGVSYAYISRIEAGARNPSVKALRAIAPKLGVSPHMLEFGVANPDRERTRQLLEVARQWRLAARALGRRVAELEADGDYPEITDLADSLMYELRQLKRKTGVDLTDDRRRPLQRRSIR